MLLSSSPPRLKAPGIRVPKSTLTLVIRECSGHELVRKASDTFNFLRHIMRATLSVQPKCSHRCVSLKKFPIKGKPERILKRTTQNSTKQTCMRMNDLNISRFKLFRSISLLGQNCTYNYTSSCQVFCVTNVIRPPPGVGP